MMPATPMPTEDSVLGIPSYHSPGEGEIGSCPVPTATTTAQRNDVDPEPSFYHSVLMDHEYENYTVFDEFLREMTSPDNLDSINGIDNIQSEIEVMDEPQFVRCERETRHDMNSVCGTNLDIPPSPATATLQEILQLAYNDTQGSGIEEFISYDQHHLTLDDHSDINDLDMETFHEIETNTSPNPIFKNMTNQTISKAGSINLDSGNETSSDTNSVTVPLITNTVDRMFRFKSGLIYICTRLKRMRQRTGATGEGFAEYEEDQYRYDASSDSFKLLVKRYRFPENIISFEEAHDGDDHRYAAQILTQTSSSNVSDHQYANWTNGSSGSSNRGNGVDPLIAYESELERDGSSIMESKPSYEKRTYERNKSFHGHLLALFSGIVKKLEVQTGALISLTVSYDNQVFNKNNYEEALQTLIRKKRHRNQDASSSPSKRQKQVSQASVQNSERPSTPNVTDVVVTSTSTSERAFPDICNSEPVLPLTNPSPICVKCNSATPKTNNGKNGYVGWVRCADALCQYLIHAACLGFIVHSRKVLKTLPIFYCTFHRSH